MSPWTCHSLRCVLKRAPGEIIACACLHIAQQSVLNRPQDRVQASLHMAVMYLCWRYLTEVALLGRLSF